MKLIDFEGVFAAFDQPTGLVDNAWFTECHQLFCIGKGNLLLEFIARQATIEAWALNGDKGLIVANSDTYGASPLTANIALTDVIT